jgi:hypothetical protein
VDAKGEEPLLGRRAALETLGRRLRVDSCLFNWEHLNVRNRCGADHLDALVERLPQVEPCRCTTRTMHGSHKVGNGDPNLIVKRSSAA